MTSTYTKLIAGNWKMNCLRQDGKALTEAIIKNGGGNGQVLLCPPFTLLSAIHDLVKNSDIRLGAQDCHAEKNGAYTGDISAAMLKDMGCTHVITGHSERRNQHSEASALVRKKTEAALAEGLIAVICIGESLEERKSGKTLEVVEKQLQESIPATATPENMVIAYEPVWAIGTGEVPTIEEIAEVHDYIADFTKSRLTGFAKPAQILYGGSVKAANAAEILGISNVGGVLVGGASLDAEEFTAIINSA